MAISAEMDDDNVTFLVSEIRRLIVKHPKARHDDVIRAATNRLFEINVETYRRDFNNNIADNVGVRAMLKQIFDALKAEPVKI